MRGARRNAEAVLPHQRAFLGHDIGNVVVLGHHLQDVPVPLHRQIHLSGEQQILPVVLCEELDVRFLPDQQFFGLLDFCKILRIVGVAEVLEGHTQHALVEQGNASGVLGRVEHHLPTVRNTVDPRLAVANTLRPPHVGDAVLAARIEVAVLKRWVEVLEIGNHAQVDRLQHLGDNHLLYIIVGRYNHVITRIALFELGEEFVVVRKQVHLDRNARRLLEIVERGLTNVGVPVVEVELGFFGSPTVAGQQGNASGGRAESSKEVSSSEVLRDHFESPGKGLCNQTE